MAAPFYTTSDKVKAQFEDIDTDITDPEILVFINTAESLIDCVMKKSFRENFDSTKHGIIEETATLLVAFKCLSVQPTGDSGNISTSRAALMADLWWAQSRRNLKFLEDPRVIQYLEDL